MPKRTFQANANGLPKIQRRSVLGGIATSAACAIGTSGPDPAFADRAPVTKRLSDKVMENYRRSSSARERMEHHLYMAAQALDEIVDAPASRWFVTMGGGQPEYAGPYLNVERLDGARDPNIPGLIVETTTILTRT